MGRVSSPWTTMVCVPFWTARITAPFMVSVAVAARLPAPTLSHKGD
jgi:hypothetical protein